jgi:hypothetical protein
MLWQHVLWLLILFWKIRSHHYLQIKIQCEPNLFQINNVNFINLFKNKDNIISLSKEQKYFIIHIIYTSYEKDKPNNLLQYIRRNYVLCNQQKSMTTSPKYYMCDLNHKILFWILFIRIHSYILMRHVTSRWWSDNKMESVNFHHFYFIYMAFMTDDKETWTFNYHYND